MMLILGLIFLAIVVGTIMSGFTPFVAMTITAGIIGVMLIGVALFWLGLPIIAIVIIFLILRAAWKS